MGIDSFVINYINWSELRFSVSMLTCLPFLAKSSYFFESIKERREREKKTRKVEAKTCFVKRVHRFFYEIKFAILNDSKFLYLLQNFWNF